MTDLKKIERIALKNGATIVNISEVKHLATLYHFASGTISAKRSLGILPYYTCMFGGKKTIFID